MNHFLIPLQTALLQIAMLYAVRQSAFMDHRAQSRPMISRLLFHHSPAVNLILLFNLIATSLFISMTSTSRVISANCIDRVGILTPTGILKRALCGNTTQPLIISNSSTIIVALDTGLAGKSTGFNLVYNTTGT